MSRSMVGGMSTTKLSSEFEMESDLIHALKILHSRKKSKKSELFTLYKDVLTKIPVSKPSAILSLKKGQANKSLTTGINKKVILSKNYSKDQKKIAIKSDSSSSSTSKKNKLSSSTSSKDPKRPSSSLSKSKVSSKGKYSPNSFASALNSSTKVIKKSSKKDSTSKNLQINIDDSTTEDESDSMSHSIKGSSFSMDTSENACRVCKKMNSNAKNQIVECQGCHSMYHQECHTPRMSSDDIQDPRFVWYCAKCSIHMNQMAKKSIRSSDAKASVNQSTASTFLNKPFRRFDAPMTSLKEKSSATSAAATSSSSSSSSSSQRLNKQGKGLSAMAANISRQTTEQKPKHSISFLQNIPVHPASKTKNKVTSSSSSSSSSSKSSSKTSSSSSSSSSKTASSKNRRH